MTRTEKSHQNKVDKARRMLGDKVGDAVAILRLNAGFLPDGRVRTRYSLAELAEMIEVKTGIKLDGPTVGALKIEELGRYYVRGRAWSEAARQSRQKSQLALPAPEAFVAPPPEANKTPPLLRSVESEERQAVALERIASALDEMLAVMRTFK